MKKLKGSIALITALSMSLPLLGLTSCSDLPRRPSEEEEEEEETSEDTEETTDAEVSEPSEVSETTLETTETSTSEPSQTAAAAQDGEVRYLDDVLYEYSGDYVNIAEEYLNVTDEETGDEIYYTALRLSPDSMASYPALKAAIDDLNEDLYLTAKSQVSDGQAYCYGEFHMRRSDEHFLSFVLSPGSDGEFVTRNWFTDSGEEVKLEDIFVDPDEVLSAYGIPGESGFVVEPCGVTFLVADDEGYDYETVLYKGNEDLFTDRFVPMEDDWIMDLSDINDEDYIIDIGNDGTPDEINLVAEFDQYDMIEDIEVEVNGSETEPDEDYVYGYGISARLVAHDSSYYMFVELISDNDYVVTYLFEIKADSAVYMGEYFEALTGLPVETSNDYIGDWAPLPYKISSCYPSDPNQMFFYERVHMLSTYDLINPAYFGPDGSFNVDESGFGYASGCHVLTALQEVDGVAQNVPEGAEVMIVGANKNNGQIALWDLETGDIYYVEFDNSDWPYTVAGSSEEDAFSGMMYAG